MLWHIQVDNDDKIWPFNIPNIKYARWSFDLFRWVVCILSKDVFFASCCYALFIICKCTVSILDNLTNIWSPIAPLQRRCKWILNLRSRLTALVNADNCWATLCRVFVDRESVTTEEQNLYRDILQQPRRLPSEKNNNTLMPEQYGNHL